MFTCYRAVGWTATLYFISLVVFGNIIMLNLFLAILLGNFEEASVLMKEIKFVEKQKLKMKKQKISKNNQVNQEGQIPDEFA